MYTAEFTQIVTLYTQEFSERLGRLYISAITVHWMCQINRDITTNNI